MRDRRYRRDTKKKRFIETLAAQGTVSHAAQAAGVSRNTAYRWRREDHEFAESWDEAHENAVDAVESTIYQQAVGGNTIEHRHRTGARRNRRENGAACNDS
jgi:transposase-like protein